MVADSRTRPAPMLAFVSAGLWLATAWGYGVLVPGMALSGLCAIAATIPAPAVPACAGLVLTPGAVLLCRPWLLAENDLAWKALSLPFIVAVAFVLHRRRRALSPTAGASQWTS